MQKDEKEHLGRSSHVGSTCIKSWCVNQAVVALSSGEAEYYAIVRGASQGLGIVALLSDLGMWVKLEILTDSSAAKGTAMRTGLGNKAVESQPIVDSR